MRHWPPRIIPIVRLSEEINFFPQRMGIREGENQRRLVLEAGRQKWGHPIAGGKTTDETECRGSGHFDDVKKLAEVCSRGTGCGGRKTIGIPKRKYSLIRMRCLYKRTLVRNFPDCLVAKPDS